MASAVQSSDIEPTNMQAAFVVHYVSTPGCVGNAAAAARAAGYSETSAREIGWQLLHKPHVREAVDRALREALSGPIATLAVAALREILENREKHAPKLVAEVARAVLDRGGFSQTSGDRRAQEDSARGKPDSAKTLAELDAEIEERMAVRRRLEEGLPVANASASVEK